MPPVAAVDSVLLENTRTVVNAEIVPGAVILAMVFTVRARLVIQVLVSGHVWRVRRANTKAPSATVPASIVRRI